VKPDGTISLMQSSAVLLNDVGTARELRARLLSEFVVEEVINLAPLRYVLFSSASKATAPPAIVTMRLSRNNEATDDFIYMCPKPARTVEDGYRLIISPYDVHTVRAKEVLFGRNALTTLLWGSRRDVTLLGKLSFLPTLQGMKKTGEVITREGVIRGNHQKEQPTIVGRKMLESPNFPDSAFLTLNPATLPTNTNPKTDSRASTNFAAFAAPQLLIKQSWMRINRRFRAARIVPPGQLGVLCSQSYVSVSSRAENEKFLDAACLVYNSSFALYWLYLTNHRLASFIAEATVTDLLQVPLPTLKDKDLLAVGGFAEVDEHVRAALGLQEADWSLVSDFFNYTLPDFKQLPNAPGERPTDQKDSDELLRYCNYLLPVLEAAFDDTERFAATIFREDGPEFLAVRLVAIHLDRFDNQRIRFEKIASPLLFQKLQELEGTIRVKPPESGGITFQRVVRVYSHYDTGRRRVPTLFIIKPDQAKYWTASAGMRDADEAFSEIILWEDSKEETAAAREDV
ncbi:MAG: SAM-dependent DNA methyltransferase, partial [Planctomycetia bacterium]|nr:SAM-dependent DNA methyltransferase [Planctomycetia bacterium]